MVLYVTAIHTFVAEHGDELEFQAGEKIEVIEKDDAFGDGWWKVSATQTAAGPGTPSVCERGYPLRSLALCGCGSVRKR